MPQALYVAMQIKLKYSENNMQSDRGYRSIASTLHMNCTNGNLPIDFNFYGNSPPLSVKR